MLFVLPEVLYYDIDKDEQKYDEKPKAIFRINVITRFYDTQLSRYTNRWFQNVGKTNIDAFQKEAQIIINFAIGKKKKAPEDETLYIIDDLEDEEEEELPNNIDEDDYEAFNFLGGSGLVSAIATAIAKITFFGGSGTGFLLFAKRIIRKMWRAIKRFGKAVIRFARRMWRRGRILIKRVWRRHIKPFIRRMKRIIVRFIVRMKRVIRKAWRIFKRYLRIIGKRILRAGRIFFKVTLKRFARTIFKTAVKFIGHAVSAVATSTGVGVVLAIAIEAAFIAWDIYDLTHLDTEPPEDFGDDPEAAKLIEDEENRVSNMKYIDEEFPAPPIPKSLKSYRMEEASQSEIKSMNNQIVDEVSRKLYDSSNYSFQILGRFYEFYKQWYEWLLNEQNYIAKITTATSTNLNLIQDTVLEQMDKFFNKEWSKLVKEHLPKKDQTKVKKIPKRNSMKVLLEEDKYYKEGHSRWFHFSNGVKLKEKDDVIIKKKNTIPMYFYWWIKEKKQQFIKQNPNVVSNGIFGEGINIDAKVDDMFNMQFATLNVRREKNKKKRELQKKEYLLYQLLCCFVWIKKCCQDQCIPSNENRDKVQFSELPI